MVLIALEGGRDQAAAADVSMTWHGRVMLGSVRCGLVWPVRLGAVWSGRFGKAWSGIARWGRARNGRRGAVMFG